MKVMVFKTNLEAEEDVAEVKPLFERKKEIRKWSVDLEDCDRVLRIETDGSDEQDIIGLVRKSGYECEVLL